MATSRISNTVKSPDGTAISGVSVVAMLMPSGGFRISDFTEVARIVRTTTNASGLWQLDLERNANVTPSNSWYEIVEDIPAAHGGRRVWTIAVGASDQSLLGSLVTPAEQQPTVVPAGTVYLDQAAADARYAALDTIGDDTPSTIEPDDAADAGVSTAGSRGDHAHAIATAAPSSIGLAGSNSEGAATSFARSNHIHAYNPPACRVYNTAAETLVNNTALALSFNTERYDTDTMHSTASQTSRITFNTAGVYDFGASVSVTGEADYTSVVVDIRLNGTTVLARDRLLSDGAFSSNQPVLSVGAQWKFSAGDYIEVVVTQENTSANSETTVAGGAPFSPEFWAAWIGVG